MVAIVCIRERRQHAQVFPSGEKVLELNWYYLYIKVSLSSATSDTRRATSLKKSCSLIVYWDGTSYRNFRNSTSAAASGLNVWILDQNGLLSLKKILKT